MSTDAPTPAPTPHEPFSLLVNDWSDTQHTVFNVKSACAENASFALVAVLTQLAISQWIWSSKAKRNHNAPVYLVSLVVFVLLWSMLMNGDQSLDLYHPLPVGFYIAVPLLACGGPVLNLLFCWAWGIFGDTDNKNNEHDDCGETANGTYYAILLHKDDGCVSCFCGCVCFCLCRMVLLFSYPSHGTERIIEDYSWIGSLSRRNWKRSTKGTNTTGGGRPVPVEEEEGRKK